MSVPAPGLKLLTPPGVGGIAVVALAGPDRWQRALPLLRSRAGLPLGQWRGTRPRLALLWLEGRAADEVLVLDRPESSQLEIHLHGSPAVLEALARQAGPLQPEDSEAATRLFLGAESREQLALALEQRQPQFEDWLAELSARPPQARIPTLEGALRRSAVAMALSRPQRLVLCGAKNAGKSTLMNRLLFQERVLTSEHPGTTRDPVRERTTLSGYPYDLVDTAGEGQAKDVLDRMAIQRGRQELQGEGMRLLVVDGSRPAGDLERRLLDQRTLVLRNKMDLPQAVWPEGISASLELSCLSPSAAPEIRQRVGEALRCLRGLPRAGPVGGPAALDPRQLRQLQDEMKRTLTATGPRG